MPKVNPHGIRMIADDQGEIVTFGCGHKRWAKFTLTIDDKNLKLSGDPLAKCGQCHLTHLRSTVIRCAKCGEPILAGEIVRFWQDVDVVGNPHKDVGQRVRYPADKYSGVREGYVGCMTLSCCLDGCSFTGNWDGTNIIDTHTNTVTAASIPSTNAVSTVRSEV